MIDFVIILSDLCPHVLDTRVQIISEHSSDHYLVLSWIRSHVMGMMLDRPDVPRCVVTTQWECLAEALVCEILYSHLQQNFYSILSEAGDTESEWTMFRPSVTEILEMRKDVQIFLCFFSKIVVYKMSHIFKGINRCIIINVLILVSTSN